MGKKNMGKGMFIRHQGSKDQGIRRATSVGHDPMYNELVKEKMGMERTGDMIDDHDLAMRKNYSE